MNQINFLSYKAGQLKSSSCVAACVNFFFDKQLKRQFGEKKQRMLLSVTFAYWVVTVYGVASTTMQPPTTDTVTTTSIPLPDRCAFALPNNKDAFVASLNSKSSGGATSIDQSRDQPS